MAADDQDAVGGLDARKRRIEIDCRDVADIVRHASLARFHLCRTTGLEQRLGGEHRLAIDHVAGDGSDAGLLAFELACNRVERFLP